MVCMSIRVPVAIAFTPDCKVRECDDYDPHEMPTHMHATEQAN
jgi:hypothetical protein